MGSFGASIFIIIFTSCLGLAYWMYGKRESDFWFMIGGAALMVYPYVVSGALMMLIVGILIAAAPFAAKRYL